ncbi:glycosyltransferase [Acinetobacter baumannii]|uniref:glycosyltransferase n=1 Tax=Acinetobacter baumannii TaxID=470 RepID=UPI001D6A88F5|nr:glycosyltransferase [Acinetobacter baumannii]EHU1307237.1 glycosyltransferase [Acinetobacter baumannii]EHU2440906.1 glycosyltransferase [Acinetobacter baumannii]MCW1510982.1 glycosyltransferase [Acinetobacter baumannii]MDK6033125.1 glycosyltransferase [Acinetobacter baumannii]MDK6071209.1 glycosyltransferase [Acinetobacter baumannii]
MKILHTAAIAEKSSGIVNQMRWEQEAASSLGLEWKVKIFTLATDIVNEEDDLFVYSSLAKKDYSTFRFRKEYYNWLYSKRDEVDCYILRYTNFDIYQFYFIRKVGKPVYLIHHTLELPELKSGKGFKAFLQFSAESILGKYSIKNCKENIGVTEEICEYIKKRSNRKSDINIIYPNGVFYSTDRYLEDQRYGEIPEIVFIASYFYPWHGLDLLLNDLNNCDKNFILHIVGNVEKSDENIVKHDSRVKFYGHLNNTALDDLLKRAWVGLSSFSLYRKGMQQACTLKVREYLKAGIPVYAGYEDVFPQKFKYYRIGKPSMQSILNFAEEVRLVSKSEVMSSAEPFISKRSLLNTLYREICKIESKSHN